ncbi:MAG: hypothetical protein ABI890_10540 [Lapillicoccus sp.]
MALSLPTNPDLERFRRDARRLQRGVRAGDERALALVTRFHPDGAEDAASFPLQAAQHVVARGYGFGSWPRLIHYLEIAEPLRRDPTAPLPDDGDPLDAFLALACLVYSEDDGPHRWERARTLLATHPDLPARSLYAAATVGDPVAVAGYLARDRSLARAEGGPHRWTALTHLAYSRVPQVDPAATARLLVDAGADVDAGYLWGGLPTPFTVLTGCFGEGEQGPGRQPRHPQWEPIARLLLDHGAAANDGQTLYNRMFNPDDSHLVVLFDYGLGTGDLGVWRDRLGDNAETVAEMMGRQVGWAVEHGMTKRLELLTQHGFGPAGTSAPRRRAELPPIHRAHDAAGVRGAVEGGADVDARVRGRTALHEAAFLGDVALTTALLEAGADPDLVDAEYGTTPLVWAEHFFQTDVADVLRPVTGLR